MIWGWVSAAVAVELGGVVLGADALPVVAATVVAYDERQGVEVVATDSAGRFLFVDLADAPVRLRLIPPGGSPWREEWSFGARDFCEAEPVAPGGADLTWTLVEGASISGRLEGVAEDLGGFSIFASSAETPGLTSRTAITASDGSFVIHGVYDDLASGYVLEARKSGYPNQFYSGAYSRAAAAAVDPGETEPWPLLVGGRVSGTAEGPEGPVASGEVVVTSGGLTKAFPVTDGAWDAPGLIPGDASIYLRAGGLELTWAPSDDRPITTYPLVDDGDVIADIAIEAAGESIFRAKIAGYASDQDPEAITGLLYNDDRSVALSAQADESGNLQFRRVPAGSWSLYVFGVGAGLVADWVRDFNTGEPRVFSVVGDTQGGILPVPQAGTVSGVVTDEGGAPVWGADVIAKNSLGEQVYAQTDRDGVYRILGLDGGFWALSVQYTPVCEGLASFVPVYFEASVNPLWAGGVPIVPGDAWTWDPVMPVDRDADGMGDTWELSVGLDPTVDDAGGDPDGDGASNLEEYQLGLYPFTAERSPRDCGCGVAGVGSSGAAALAAVWLTRRRRGSRADEVRCLGRWRARR